MWETSFFMCLVGFFVVYFTWRNDYDDDTDIGESTRSILRKIK